MEKSKVIKEKRYCHSGVFVPAGLFIGMGVGMLIGQIPAGLFIGLGLGFLAMALAKSRDK
jgi:hypothetical protein